MGRGDDRVAARDRDVKRTLAVCTLMMMEGGWRRCSEATMLIDTHAHLDDHAFATDREATLGRAREVGVRAIINVGFSEERWATTAALAAAHADVYAVLGLHPHEAAAWNDTLLERLRLALAGPKVVGLGEIGLDFYRDYAPPERQRIAFRAQLALAHELDLPMVMHSRAAEDEVVATLAEAGSRRGVLHSFSGSLATAEQALALGLHISLTGPVSYPTGEHQRALARLIPADRLLLETDCPYLAPQARRGKRNEPAFLPFTAAAIAAARGVPTEEIIAATGRNALALFGLPEPA
jgi:TatD DNase family protein